MGPQRQKWGDVAKSQGYLGPLEAERGKKDSPLEPLEGVRPCQHPTDTDFSPDTDFGLLASRAAREYISVVFSRPTVAITAATVSEFQ